MPPSRHPPSRFGAASILASRLAGPHLIALFLAGLALISAGPAMAASQRQIDVAVVVPITGPLALEGTSQQNGALLALRGAQIPGLTIEFRVLDAGASPEAAVNAFIRAVSANTNFVVASLFGPQILALLPLAEEMKVPLLTVSGTARVTELGNPFVFRFFPSDRAAKLAQARYVIEQLKPARVALVTQSTAYGQSGREALSAVFAAAGLSITVDEVLPLSLRDMTSVVQASRAADVQAVVLQLHAAPTALFLRQWAAGLEQSQRPPVIAGSALHQPATAALLEPAELAQSCAETGSAPAAAESGPLKAFADAYRAAFGTEPDGYAAAQYDGVRMALAAIAAGAKDGAALARALARDRFQGVASAYGSDGAGNMAHDVTIVCYDGASRNPRIAVRYDGIGLDPAAQAPTK